MRVRYGLAAAFAVVVLALIFVRDEGYLGGRTEGGPLTMGTEVEGAGPTGSTEGFGLMPSLDGDPVEIQRVRPQFKSPGLNFRAARIPPGGTSCRSCRYPRAGELFVGTEFTGDTDAVVGLRAARPGVYYALGLIVDYRRGARRFRLLDTGSSMCIAAGRTDRDCEQVELPADVDLAELGGASREGRRSARITLANLTNRIIEVGGVAVPGGGATVPDRFGLAGRGGRSVRVPLECGEPVESLEATVDDEPVRVPLSVPLEARC